MNTILFTPLTVGAMTLRNRVVVPPMCMWEAVEGVAQDFHLRHYGALAASGVGAVTIEATGVVPEGRISPWCLGIWDDETAAGIGRIVRAMKTANPDVKVILQLAHAGRKGSCNPADESTVTEGGWETVAPSAISAKPTLAIPREMTEAEILAAADAFAAAAARAAAVGVDAVEIHAAHGYLIHQFLSPIANRRTDCWGGSFENRTRFACLVMERVHAALPESVTMGLRISATDWLPDGWTPEESVELVRLAQARGAAFVDVSTGAIVPCAIPVAPGYQMPFAAQIRRETGMTTFGVGLITNAFQAETALQLGACDAVDIGRAILDDNNWAWHAMRDLGVRPEGAAFRTDKAFTQRR